MQKLLMSDDYVPCGTPEWVDGYVIVLADVLYWGDIKDPSETTRIKLEIEKVKSQLKMCSIYNQSLRYELRMRRKHLEYDLANLPRNEVWQREYKVLGRAHSREEAQRIINNYNKERDHDTRTIQARG